MGLCLPPLTTLFWMFGRVNSVPGGCSPTPTPTHPHHHHHPLPPRALTCQVANGFPQPSASGGCRGGVSLCQAGDRSGGVSRATGSRKPEKGSQAGVRSPVLIEFGIQSPLSGIAPISFQHCPHLLHVYLSPAKSSCQMRMRSARISGFSS